MSRISAWLLWIVIKIHTLLNISSSISISYRNTDIWQGIKYNIGLLESLITEEYEIPLGSKTALLVLQNMKSPQLVIDNKDCATGEEYVSLNMPKWSYLFILLHFANFINGAIGCAFAIAGIAATTAISANKKFSPVVKLVLFFAVTFGIGYAVYSL